MLDVVGEYPSAVCVVRTVCHQARRHRSGPAGRGRPAHVQLEVFVMTVTLPTTAPAVADEAGMDTPWVAPTWEQVVREHSARVYRLAYRLSGNAQDAEDLTQETFIRVFRSLAQYTPGTFEGWLHRITTKLFLDMVRGEVRGPLVAPPAGRAPGAAGGPGRRPRPGAGVRRDALRLRRPGGARRAAAGLPRRGRALRPRGAVVRGDRRDPRHQDRHGPQSHPPRPVAAACRAVAPRSRPVRPGAVMSCPGELLSAFVDGEVDHATRERVLSHLLDCVPCRVEVDGLRTLKTRLSWAGAEKPLPSAALQGRLHQLVFPGVEPLQRPAAGTVRPRSVRPAARAAAPARPRRTTKF